MNLNLNCEEFKDNLFKAKFLFDGAQYIFRFPNNYGASVVKHLGSYGSSEDLWELAVLRFEGDKWDLTCVEERSRYLERMQAVERAAMETDPYLASYILKAVTEGLSFNYLKARLEIPCSRDMYYDRYRKFFWLLDKER